ANGPKWVEGFVVSREPHLQARVEKRNRQVSGVAALMAGFWVRRKTNGRAVASVKAKQFQHAIINFRKSVVLFFDPGIANHGDLEHRSRNIRRGLFLEKPRRTGALPDRNNSFGVAQVHLASPVAPARMSPQTPGNTGQFRVATLPAQV